MHCIAYIPTAHFLVENQTKAVTPFAILSRCGERMELRFDAVFLGAKTKSLGQWEHADAVGIERIPGHMIRIVGERFAFVGTIERRALETVTWDGTETKSG